MYEIKTSDYVKTYDILVDGNSWTMKAPGAGDELAMSQATRRAKLLEKKIEDGSAVESDFDLYDKLESKIFSMFEKIFNDGTSENTSVKNWVSATPISVINDIFEDIKKQIGKNGKESVQTS